MKLGWANYPGGIGVALGLLAKTAFGAKPVARTLEQRLAMLRSTGVPLDDEVTIRWNDQQVPFIEAASDNDLMVALGVVHAHLRLGQLEIMRRIAYGRVSEMVGPLGVEIDRSLRLFDFGRAVPAMIEAMTPEQRGFAEKFVEGINHVLLDGGEKPFEFGVLGIGIEPWTLTDLMTLGRLAGGDIIWSVYMTLVPVRDRLPPDVWRALWPRLLSSGMPAARAGREAGLGEQLITAMQRNGSNSVAVSARRSRTGAAMIASDPHLTLSLPSAWVIVGMHSPGFHCVGLMMPGMPYVLLGRNPWIAWGGTSLHAQSSDLFDVSGMTHTLTERETRVRVRGGRTRTLRLRESAFGPVVSDGALLSSPRPTALRWMGHRPSNELGAMLDVARARDWTGYYAALRSYGVSGANLVFAGGDGRVAHVVTAHLPKRPNALPGDLVLSPQDGEHWNRIADYTEMPLRLDPPEGFVASANEEPRGGDFPVGYFFSPTDRSERLADLLGTPDALDMEAMRRLQRDAFNPPALLLRDRLVSALPASPGPAQGLVDALRAWDSEYAVASAGALAFELLLAQVARQLRDGHSLRAYNASWMAYGLLLEDMKALSDEALRDAVQRALPAAVQRFDRYRTWGEVHRIRLKHWLGALPGLGRYINVPSFATIGSSNTVCKNVNKLNPGPHNVGFGASARHVSDLSDLDANDFVLLGGQDGWAGSANYCDQVAIWNRGEYVRVPMRLESVRAAFTHTTVLRPAARG